MFFITIKGKEDELMVRKLIVCVIGVVFMAGCSGGDGSSTARGGDSGSTITQTGQYNGLTTPALFTVTNAKALSSDAYTTNRVVATATGVGKITTISGATPCLLQGITSTLKERVTSTLLRSSSSNKIVALTIKDTITGMSGSITYQTELDQTTGNFTGKITFTEYQDTASSATITGTTDFTGNLNTATSIFTSLNMQMNSLLGILGGTSFTLNGTISFSGGKLNVVSIASVVLTNNSTGNAYWFKDYAFTYSGNMVTISGTYYDPSEGYVVVTTITPLTAASADAIPLSGELLFTGTNKTAVRLTFTDSGQTVEVDTAGNSIFTIVP